MVNFLSKKFDIESESSYIIKQIDTKYLEIAHMEARCQCFVAIKGSSPLKSVFTPEKTTLHAASQLCICTKCMNSCELCWRYWLSAYLRHHTSVIYLVGIQSSFYMCIVFFVWFNEATSYYYEFFKSKPLLVTSFWFFHQKCINKLH